MYNGGYDRDVFKVQLGTGMFQGHVPMISLPHQCDDWEIGDPDNARLLIEDLQKAIDQWEAHSATVRDA